MPGEAKSTTHPLAGIFKGRQMTKRPHQPHAGGRPSLYKPEYCDEVITVCSTGLSLTAFAGVIGAARSTIQNWMGEHPEFLVACKKAMANRALYLESGMLNPEATGPAVTARRFALVNATVAGEPSDWAEKAENTVNLGDGVAELIAAISGKSRSL